MTTIRKTYTTEFKVKVVREILREEKSLSQIASEYGTHTNVISRWRDQALAALPTSAEEDKDGWCCLLQDLCNRGATQMDLIVKAGIGNSCWIKSISRKG